MGIWRASIERNELWIVSWLVIRGYDEDLTLVISNSNRWSGVQRTNLRKSCANAAFFIASDRVSRFLPSAAASIVFLIQIFAGFWKTLATLSDTYQKSNPVSAGLNRAPHNIAFGTLFFWLPFVVLLTALVGGSQTSHMIPRVLENFRESFEQSHSKPRDDHPNSTHEENSASVSVSTAVLSQSLGKYETDSFPDISSELYRRWNYGGIPVWQIRKFEDLRAPRDEGPSHLLFAIIGMTLSLLLVTIPTGCAMAVSWLTPTEGFGCRAITQLSFLIMWVVSAMVDWILFLWAHTLPATHQAEGEATISSRERYMRIYQITFMKDTFFTAGTIVTLTWTALGVFNKCECWCKWPSSSGFISFPQDEFIFRIIEDSLRTLFPIVVTCALGSQLIIFLGVWVYFRDGYRVLKQQDIDSVLKSKPSTLTKVQRRFEQLGYAQRTNTEVGLTNSRSLDTGDTTEEYPLIERTV